MKIIYLGTPGFAVAPLERLIKKGYDIVAVVTNCDKPVGRKHILTAPPVKQLALQHNIKVLQYNKIRLEGVEDLRSLKPDLMITCAFGQILSQEILDIPTLGVINIHASLLPYYRGASPIHYAILNGEKKTGITIMKTDAGIDTGDIIAQKEIEISENETCGELFERLSLLGADMIEKTLPDILSGNVQLIKQDNERATFTKIIKKEMARIDFENDAESVVNQIRAFNPSPVAYFLYKDQPMKVYSAKVSDMSGEAGTVLKADKELVIACKKNSISIIMIQKPGGKPMDIKSFLAGNKITTGEKI